MLLEYKYNSCGSREDGGLSKDDIEMTSSSSESLYNVFISIFVNEWEWKGGERVGVGFEFESPP